MFGDRAVAALELALSSPLLILTLGGVAYLGLAQYDRAMLANAVAAGAQYAVLTGSNVTQANITSVIQDASGLPNAATSVTVSFASVSPGVPSPGWYCVTGSAPTVTSSTSGGTCTDGSSAGYYMSFKASYTVNGFMNGFREALSLTMSEQATVRLQ
jgi:Flp pilus assembly protein TadG